MTRRAVLLAVLFLLAVPSMASASPGVVTFLFGRAILYDIGANCRQEAGTATIYQAADALQARGATAVTEPSVGYTNDHDGLCKGSAKYASWDDLQRLHSQYGWEAISAGDGRDNLTTLSDSQVRSESCGVLDSFRAHGFDRAWGLFAYPGNKWDSRTQAIVGDCYSYGRTYRGQWNTFTGTSPLRLVSPWFVRSNSLNGGACNDPSLACYDLVVKNHRRYDNVADMSADVRHGDNSWALMQVYRLRVGTGPDHNCGAADWRAHWTQRAEDYCLVDWLRIVDAVPASSVIADPAYVAQREGRGF